jgi:hypothetical protein
MLAAQAQAIAKVVKTNSTGKVLKKKPNYS